MNASTRALFATLSPGKSSLGDAQSANDAIQRDPLFYDAPLIILVEGTLFKVSRSYFETSDVFRETYLLSRQGEEIPNGYADEKPLRLDGVDAAEFRCLLKVMIRRDSEDMFWTEWMSVLKLSQMWQMTTIHSLALRKIETRINNPDEWITALKISTRLRIQGLRDLSIRMLAEKLSSLKKIELATECKIQPWLLQGYTDFVMREQVISVEEEEQLGWSRTFNLFCVRHRHLESESYWNNGHVKSDIQNTFASEFADIVTFDNSPISHLRPGLRTATTIRRDEVYYHVDIIFSVEDILFKLPRYLFEESSDIFRDMFLLPTPEGIPFDGSSDEQPLFLKGVCKIGFRRLLRAMEFPAKFGSQNLKEREDETTLCREWASALELSCMWQMAKVRDLAIKEILQLQYHLNADDQLHLLRLSTKLGITKIRDICIRRSITLQPVKRIQLGIELQVHSWLLEGYVQSVQAKGGILVEHAELLGKQATLKLFRIRDEYLWKLRRGNHYGCSDFVTKKIKEVFAEELKGAQAAVWAGK